MLKSCRFPKIHLDTNRLYVEDGNFLTSAGAAGGLDCCLYLIRKIHGATVANEGRLNITLETVYGHAVKKLVLPQGENVVQFFPKRQG